MQDTKYLKADHPINITNKKTLKFCLAGNPNCGKTTLFNNLTGSTQYVGNWPGVTVEKKEGKLLHNNTQINLLDLPGIYSLSPYSPEEIITRNCLTNESYDLIINIVDSTNIERNLYLTTQLLELGRPIVIALNMIDLLEKRGDKINYKLLEKLLNVPIIPISASKQIGIEHLINSCVSQLIGFKKSEPRNIYSEDINITLKNIENILLPLEKNLNTTKRWAAVKLFEGDHIESKFLNLSESQYKKINSYISQIKITKNFDRETIIADQRYKYICRICNEVISRKLPKGSNSISDKIDIIVTNRFLAIPIFLSLILIIFFITFGSIGSYLKEQTEWLINDCFSNSIESYLTNLGASSWSKSLIVDGIIHGVGAVLSFMPQIIILFTLLSLLEDTGYMARAAFIMDQILRKIGLSGKSFVPMLMGFGCTVPAVLGTRILENKKDKQLTIMLIPFMSCSAKMPVYALFISVFFNKYKPLVIFSIYILGILLSILTAWFFKNTILKGEVSSFVMELPPYRLPHLKSLILHVWERVKDFITKAGTVLLGASIIIWFLQSFNFQMQMISSVQESILYKVGSFISPIFLLCGFGNWQASVSLITGLVAKESIISTMSVLYGASTESHISSALLHTFSPLSAYSFLVFVLLYTPCIAAMSAIKKEMESTRLTIITILYQLFIAWFASAMVYQFGTLISNIIK